MTRKKWIIMLTVDVIIVAALVIYFGIIRPRNKMPDQSIQLAKIEGVLLPTAREVSHFNLTDNHGKPFNQENLKGHWTLLFFGFTNCGSVCPTTLAALNKMVKLLEKELPKDQLPQVVLVSVDPENDTVARMNHYVKSFNPHFIGVRGDEKATESMEKQFHILAEKVQAEGKDKKHYTINHTAEILVFNPKGQLQAFLSYPHEANQLAKDYKIISTAN